MNVGDMMHQPAVSCTVNDSLDHAARLMWEHDCGVLPVTDGRGKVVGIVTDRDVCMATYTKGSPPWAIRTGNIMAQRAFCCHTDDPWEAAAQLMSKRQVHRLPVLDKQGELVGMLSLTDLARKIGQAPQNGADRLVLRTLLDIATPRSNGQKSTNGATDALMLPQ